MINIFGMLLKRTQVFDEKIVDVNSRKKLWMAVQLESPINKEDTIEFGAYVVHNNYANNIMLKKQPKKCQHVCKKNSGVELGDNFFNKPLSVFSENHANQRDL